MDGVAGILGGTEVGEGIVGDEVVGRERRGA